MRLLTFIAILYACLSLFAPHWKPLACIEGTGLLFYRPWDHARGTWPADQAGGYDAAPVLRGTANSSILQQWWSRVVHMPIPAPGFSLVAARSLEPVSCSKSRIAYHVDPRVPVLAGDPVVCGGAVVGFVDRIKPGGSMELKLLGKDVGRTVLAEVQGTVAGSKVRFIAGGPSLDLEGCIRVQFPSTRYGLAEGSLAYTGESPLTPGIPAGLLLGTVRLVRPGIGETREKAGLQPPVDELLLNRVAVLLPTDRLNVLEDQVLINTPPAERVAVKVKCVAGDGLPVFRIFAGLEAGLSRGDILVVNGIAVARLERVGFYSASAHLLAVPGQDLVLLSGSGAGEGRPFRARIESRKGFQYLARSDDCPKDLERGECLYLAKDPASGLERHPAFQVLDPGEGDRMILRIPLSGEIQESYCVNFTGSDRGDSQ
ncbi:MAG: hypothetical protein ACYTG7_03940 [Planctomycetota bacterium]|jgi:hypothetical protein